jgi:hypothetical protein
MEGDLAWPAFPPGGFRVSFLASLIAEEAIVIHENII